MNHEGRELTLKIPPALEARLKLAREEHEIRTGEGSCEHKMIGLLLERAIDSMLLGRSADDRPVGSIPVGELAELFGLTDVEEARRIAKTIHAEKAETAKQVAHVTRNLKGVQASAYHAIRTEANIAAWRDSMARVLRAGHVVIALLVEVADTEAADPEYKPLSSGAVH